MTLDELRADARLFIDRSISDGIACPSFGAIMPPAVFEPARRWQRHCHANGFAGIDWPTEFGGRGLSTEHAQVWSEECARAGVTPYMNFQGIVLAGGAIRTFGTDVQRERYLEATLRADIVWCQLFSEPGAGSDLAGLTTRADPSGDGWVVSGQKVWSSTAQLARHAILLARTDPNDPGRSGISFFLLDMRSPGVDVRPIRQMTGDSEFCEVFLDEAPLAADDLLGPLHGGWTVATSVLADERASVGAAAVGLRRRLRALAASVVDPRSRQRLSAIESDGAAVAHLVARSGGDPVLGPLTKLAMTELDSRITTLAVDGGGAAGMIDGPDTGPFLYSPGMRVAGGTSEIQRNLIGERLLGLPREPSPPPSAGEPPVTGPR